MTQKLLTIEEVAEFLRVQPSTILNWIRTEKINCPYYRLNGQSNYRFKKEEVELILTCKKILNNKNN